MRDPQVIQDSNMMRYDRSYLPDIMRGPMIEQNCMSLTINKHWADNMEIVQHWNNVETIDAFAALPDYYIRHCSYGEQHLFIFEDWNMFQFLLKFSTRNLTYELHPTVAHGMWNKSRIIQPFVGSFRDGSCSPDYTSRRRRRRRRTIYDTDSEDSDDEEPANKRNEVDDSDQSEEDEEEEEEEEEVDDESENETADPILPSMADDLPIRLQQIQEPFGNDFVEEFENEEFENELPSFEGDSEEFINVVD